MLLLTFIKPVNMFYGISISNRNFKNLQRILVLNFGNTYQLFQFLISNKLYMANILFLENL